MERMVTIVMLAGLFAGCAHFEPPAKHEDPVRFVTASVGMFKGRGDEVRNALRTVGCTNVVASVDDAAEHYVLVNLADGSKIRLAWDLTKSGDVSGSLGHQCRRLKQAMNAGVVTEPVIWTALEYGATSRIYAEPQNGWNVYEASDCIRRGDAGMANGDELEAITWYNEAAKRGSAVGCMKEKQARKALADAVDKLQNTK